MSPSQSYNLFRTISLSKAPTRRTQTHYKHILSVTDSLTHTHINTHIFIGSKHLGTESIKFDVQWNVEINSITCMTFKRRYASDFQRSIDMAAALMNELNNQPASPPKHSKTCHQTHYTTDVFIGVVENSFIVFILIKQNKTNEEDFNIA